MTGLFKFFNIVYPFFPLAAGIMVLCASYYLSTDPVQLLTDGIGIVFTVMVALWVGCYNVKNVIESTADRIASTHSAFRQLRTELRTGLLKRATLRYAFIFVTSSLYFSCFLLLQSNYFVPRSELVASIVFGLSAYVILDAVLFYSIIRLDINRLRERIDRENESDRARLRLIEELRQSREKQPLKADDHLRSYITVHGE